MNGISSTTEGLLQTALVDLGDRVTRMQTGGAGIEYLPPVVSGVDGKKRLTLDEAIQELDALIQHATRVRGYLDGRYGYGCGDQGHQRSVGMSNRLVTKVRRALGYTQARHDVRF